MRLEIEALEGVPEIVAGDDLGAVIVDTAERRRLPLRDGDVLVVAQKVVSKAEGRLRNLEDVEPSARAVELAHGLAADARFVQVVLDESVRVVRSERVLVVETRHGYVCANAGVDHSNVPGSTWVSLLPVDCDASARSLRDRLRELARADVSVIVADSFGRPWRMGLANVALGMAGLPALVDYRGQRDDVGKELRATVMAVGDELAAAAELVMGKTARVPVAVIRGYHAEAPPGHGHELVRPPEEDLFR